MSFLKAEWRKLLIVNYEVDPSLLQPFVPAFTELDTWEGRHYVSLVGFRFLNTRLLGIKVPFHVNFEEVNLRFYVRYKAENEWRRGVVFIKEIVPRAALSWVANSVYKEHYVTRSMSHIWENTPDGQLVSYAWYQGEHQHLFQVLADPVSQPMEPGSETEFITEHYWGYTQVNDSQTYEYQVTHPTWEHYPIRTHHLMVDFGQVYGDRFADLSTQSPTSIMLAEGSEITVESRQKIR